MEDIERMAAGGKIQGYTDLKTGEVVKAKPVQKKKGEAKGLKFMKQQLNDANIPYSTEYKFHDVRRFKFDIALPILKIAFEYEGLVSSKSRHTSITGYTRDTEKYNLAQSMGWKVFRYTALNYKNFESDLKEMFNENKTQQ